MFVRANSEVKPEIDSNATISAGEITNGFVRANSTNSKVKPKLDS